MNFLKTHSCVLGLLLLSIAVVGISDAYGELSRIQKLNYVVSSEKMYGHLAAALTAFLDDGEYKHLARAHLGHAMFGEFETSKKFLLNYPNYYQTSIQTLTTIKNTSNLDDDTFKIQASEIVNLVRRGQNMILSEKIIQTEFSLFVTTSLLETAKNSLRDSQDTTGIHQMMLRQDALGFVIRADTIFRNIDSMESKQFESTINLFEEYFLLHDYDKIDEQIKHLDKIILELYYYQIAQNKSLSLFEESNITTSSQHVDLKIEKVSGNNIVYFRGEGFSTNSMLSISYFTSDNKNPQKLQIRTSQNGDFFIPIEVHENNKVYYVSITTQKNTTQYTLY